MVGLVKLVGIVIVIFSASYAVKPATIKKVLHFWQKDNRMYVGAIINLLIGIIFLKAAALCFMPWFIVVMGILGFAKGVIIFILGKDKVVAWTESIVKAPAKQLRLLGVVGIAVGVCLIYAA